MSAGERHKELNLAQLFSDVSRTLSGFRRLLIPVPEAARATAQNDASPLSDLGSSIFSDNVCIKPCGMEDIQIAAQVRRNRQRYFKKSSKRNDNKEISKLFFGSGTS
ncbi:unnamed protein product [Gongylonema pulchrum]|uniref:Uncharacterized protein n=1 Tax=Gongylonema pulchrum TaxID=637853 RepID=A0A183DFB3_9BILA|nr:unnamed protein product [Gongylonema pulchrum]